MNDLKTHSVTRLWTQCLDIVKKYHSVFSRQICGDYVVNHLNWNTRLWQHYEHKVKHLDQYHTVVYVCHSVLGMPTTCFFMWHYMWSEIPHCQCCDHMVKHIVRYIPHCGICVPLCVRGMPTTCLFMWYFLRSQIHTVTTLWPHG